MEKKELLRKLSSEWRFLKMQAAGHPDEARKKELLMYADIYLLCFNIAEESNFPEPIDRKKALKLIQAEIQSYKAAPKINGCKMTPEWAEMIEFHKTCEKLLKG